MRNNHIWKEAYSLAEFFYKVIEEDFSNFPEEKYNNERKLRTAANDLIYYVSQAVASVMYDVNEFDWNYARKSLFTMQTLYSFSAKQNYTKLDPSIMIRIDKLIAKIDTELLSTGIHKEKRAEEEMEPWLEKYRLWKIMESKPKKD
jgi:site-specific recombinase XerD